MLLAAIEDNLLKDGSRANLAGCGAALTADGSDELLDLGAVRLRDARGACVAAHLDRLARSLRGHSLGRRGVRPRAAAAGPWRGSAAHRQIRVQLLEMLLLLLRGGGHQCGQGERHTGHGRCTAILKRLRRQLSNKLSCSSIAYMIQQVLRMSTSRCLHVPTEAMVGTFGAQNFPKSQALEDTCLKAL